MADMDGKAAGKAPGEALGKASGKDKAPGPREFAAAIIVNRADELLLLRRSPLTLRWPGKWGIAGGGMEDGETPEQALQ